jgi:hypothetical protein
MNRLGYTDRRTGGLAHLRHALDTVTAVCSLVPAAELWLPESTTADAGIEPARPVSVVALQVDGGSGVLRLEIDEATEHTPQIKAKLAAHERVLADRSGWHVVFVVPTAARLSWLRRVARPNLAVRAWAVVLADLQSIGLDVSVVPLDRSGQTRALRSVLDDPSPRRSATPVGSAAWIKLLGSGGGEELDEVPR